MIKCFSHSDFKVKFPWTSKKNIHYKGYIYINGVLVYGDEFFNLLESFNDKKGFLSLLSNINGFFAAIIEKEDFIYAAVDRVTSTSLMYKTINDLWIGDDYQFFLEKESRFLKESLNQYLVSGYVYGEKTLLNDVFQLLPGTALIYDKKNSSIEIERYYEYLPEKNYSKNYKDFNFLDELNNVHELVFSRLAENLKGRQAILPLSGGYDSRLILEMLLRFDYKNVFCFTWGKENDWQVKIAKEVTSKLGVDWICINQDSKSWRSWVESGEFEKQLRYCGALCSIPYLQENLVIKYLQKKDLINNNAIFLNGNSGDFIEGGHIPKNIKEKLSENDVVHLIMDKHLRLAKSFDLNHLSKLLHNQVKLFKARGLDVRLFLEYWEWSERQSKFVTNCIKPFETESYEWRMPFWENEIMDFWASVPINIKCGRKLFYSYYKKYGSDNLSKPNPDVSFFRIMYERLSDPRFGIFYDNMFGLNRLTGSTLKEFPNLFSRYKIIMSQNLLFSKMNSLIALKSASIIQDKWLQKFVGGES